MKCSNEIDLGQSGYATCGDKWGDTPMICKECKAVAPYLYYMKKSLIVLNGNSTMRDVIDLKYIANQILEVGGCGYFNPLEHDDYYELINS